MRIARIGFVAAIAVLGFMTASAGQSTGGPAVSPVGAPPADRTFVDARPAKDKETEFLSLWITSCDYSIRRLGDEGDVPSKLGLLQQDIQSALGNSGGAVTISKYTVYVNTSVMRRQGTYGTYGGVVPAIMSGIGSKCSKEETTAGWYAGAEITTPYSPIIVEIEADLVGKHYAVRTVYSPKEEFAGKFGEMWGSGGVYDPEATAALLDALHQANAALIDQIRQG